MHCNAFGKQFYHLCLALRYNCFQHLPFGAKRIEHFLFASKLLQFAIHMHWLEWNGMEWDGIVTASHKRTKIINVSQLLSQSKGGQNWLCLEIGNATNGHQYIDSLLFSHTTDAFVYV